MMRRRAVMLMTACMMLAGVCLGREWTSKGGKTIEAELVKVEAGQVHLKRSDGKVGTIAYDQLSDGDQRYLDSLNRQSPQQPAAAAPATAAPAATKKQTNPVIDTESLPVVQAFRRAPDNLHWLILIAILNIPVVIFVWGKMFFGGWAEFFECVRYSLTPDVVSMFRGEWGEDIWAEWKLQIFWVWSALTVAIQMFLFLQFIVPLFE